MDGDGKPCIDRWFYWRLTKKNGIIPMVEGLNMHNGFISSPRCIIALPFPKWAFRPAIHFRWRRESAGHNFSRCRDRKVSSWIDHDLNPFPFDIPSHFVFGYTPWKTHCRDCK